MTAPALSLRRSLTSLPERVAGSLRAWLRESGIRQWVRGDPSVAPRLADFPPMVMIDTTTRCNLACSHCPNSVLSSEQGFLGDMDRELFFKIIDEIARESPGTVVRPFDGGEPLMRKDLGELIGYAKRVGIRRISINTNGTILSVTRRRELIEAGIDHVEVSIDAASGDTYRKVRQSELYQRVVDNTIAYIEESKAADPASRVTVSFVAQADNQHEKEAFREFWKDRADDVLIREFHQHNGLVQLDGHLDERAQQKRHPCPYLWGRMIVHHDGKVRFCEFDWMGEHTVGDARTQSLKEIWHSEAYRRLRQTHVDGSFDHPYCGPCVDWETVTWS